MDILRATEIRVCLRRKNYPIDMHIRVYLNHITTGNSLIYKLEMKIP